MFRFHIIQNSGKGKMPDKCCVPGCKGNYKTERETVSVFRLPSDENLRSLWIKNIRRDYWLPGKRSVVCERHFEDSLVSKHEIYLDKDGNKKTFPRRRAVLLPGAIPTLIETLPAKRSEPGENVRTDWEVGNLTIPCQEEESQPELLAIDDTSDSVSEPNDLKIKIEAVTSLRDFESSVNFPSHVLLNSQESESSPRKSARISVRGRRKWTNLFKNEYEKPSEVKTVQLLKSKENISKTCPKEVRVMVRRLGPLSAKQTSEGSSLKRKPAERTPPVRRSTRSSGQTTEPSRKRQRNLQNEGETSHGEDSPQSQEVEESEEEGRFCTVCRKFVNQYTSLTKLTDTSKDPFHKKLSKLVDGERDLSVHEDGVLCPVCTRLVNYMDRMEVELSMLKMGILNCMRKQQSEQQTLKCNTDQSGPRGSGENSESSMTVSNNPELLSSPVTLPSSKNVKSSTMTFSNIKQVKSTSVTVSNAKQVKSSPVTVLNVEQVKSSPVTGSNIKQVKSTPVTGSNNKQVKSTPVIGSNIKQVKSIPVTVLNVKQVKSSPATIPNINKVEEEPESMSDGADENDHDSDFDNPTVDHDYSDEPEPKRSTGQPTVNRVDPHPPEETSVNRKTVGVPVANKGVAEKQYKCNMCSYKTTLKSVIVFHLRQHMKCDLRCDFCNVTIPQNTEKILTTIPPPSSSHKKILLSHPSSTRTLPPPDSVLPEDCMEKENSATVSVTQDSEPRKTVITSLNETHTEVLNNVDWSEMKGLCDNVEVNSEVM